MSVSSDACVRRASRAIRGAVDKDARHQNFAPVVDARTRLLLLGSLPGVRSLAEQRYYAHPRNQFWRLVGALIGCDLVELRYESRLELLRERGIGLWDTIAEARRPGSLDAAIRSASPSDLAALVARLPELRAIGFNGATSARIGRRQLGAAPTVALIDLPSSSPAFTIGFDRKLEAWWRLRPYLEQ